MEEEEVIIELPIQFVDNAKEYMQCSKAQLHVTMVGIDVLLPKPYSRRFHDFEDIQMYINDEPKDGWTKNYLEHDSNEDHFESFRDEYVDAFRRANEAHCIGLCYAVRLMPYYPDDVVLTGEKWKVMFCIELPFNDAAMELVFVMDNYWDNVVSKETESLLNHVVRLDTEKAECLARQTLINTKLQQQADNDDDAERQQTGSDDEDDAEWTDSDDDYYWDDMKEIMRRLEEHAIKVTDEKEQLIGTGRRTRSVELEQEVSVVTVILSYYALIKRIVDHIGRGKHLQILHNTDLFMQMERFYDVYRYYPSEKPSTCPRLEQYLRKCARHPDVFVKLQEMGKYPNVCNVARVAQTNTELWDFLRSTRSSPYIITFNARVLPFIAGLMTMFVPMWTAISKLPSNNVQAHVYSPKLNLHVEYAHEGDSKPSMHFTYAKPTRTGKIVHFAKKHFAKHIKSHLKPFATDVDPTNYVRRDIFPISMRSFRIAGKYHGSGHMFLVVHEKTPTEEVLYIVDGNTYSDYEKYQCDTYTVDARGVLKAVLRLFHRAFSHSKRMQSPITLMEQHIFIQEFIHVPEVAEGEPAFKYDCSFIALSNIARLHVYPAFRDICSYDIKDTATKDDIAVFWSYIRYHMTLLYQDVVLNKQGYLLDSNIPGELVENGFFWEIDMKGQRVRKLQFIDYEMIDVTDVREPREHRRCCTVQANMDFRTY